MLQKMQHVSERGTRKMYESTQRSIASSKTVPASEDFKKYSRRLVRDLELKGIVRTAFRAHLATLDSEERLVKSASSCLTFQSRHHHHHQGEEGED